MNARIGDLLHVHGTVVGQHDRVGEIIEIRGDSGGPPYVVQFEDGHQTLVYPGPDAVVESRESAGHPVR
ncbi:MAG TPA: DUF1918 domain-containing protein [Spirillospora sp.]|nr:DUF1918 domain-containing protein [Spirillospora sp.]